MELAAKKLLPTIRFSAFHEEWTLRRFGDLTKRVSEPVKVESEKLYKQIGIKSHGRGIFHKELVTGQSLGSKRVFWVQENALVVNIVFAWEQAIAKTSAKELGLIASHRFPMYMPFKNQSNISYLLYFFSTDRGRFLLELASPGGAGRNKTLGQKEFENLKFSIPSLVEQEKIASFLKLVDEKIHQFTKKKALLESYKKGVVQQIFSQQVRFKDENSMDFPEWEEMPLGECLKYLQPTPYLVKSTDYNDAYTIPVLTAGKTFVLGYTNENDGIFTKYLPAIIFDDFTTASKFVDFPFKAKSSAMKILIPKPGINIKFAYEAMQILQYEIGGHERHWISKFAHLSILVPSIIEQTKIADFLTEIDNKILAVAKQVKQAQQFKKGLLQHMFV